MVLTDLHGTAGVLSSVLEWQLDNFAQYTGAPLYLDLETWLEKEYQQLAAEQEPGHPD
jgi:hypothetical protein